MAVMANGSGDSAGVEFDDLAAALAMQGANPLAGLTPGQVASATLRWYLAYGRRPTLLASESLKWGSEVARVVAGVSKVAPEPKDWRFADPAWEHILWRRLAQSYLVTSRSLLGSVDGLDLDEKSALRARFALGLLVDACAPTNSLAGNPEALKKAAKTRGRSLYDGGRHWLHDVRKNRGMPSQVDSRPFVVGETVAVTKGSVVHRSEMFELIQYAPSTPKVHKLPTVVLPPQINRYYFLDLAPGRSFVEHTVNSGVQTFMVSWRNPGPEQRDWSLDDYGNACLEAMQVAADICGTEQVNTIGFCSGGMTLTGVLSHLAATEGELVNAATLGVTLLDTEVSSSLNMFASKRTVSAAIARSRRKGVLDGKTLATVFAWLRPNDLVWKYWVSNYLLGNNPPAFDVLAWNADSTNLPATLHAEFLHMWSDNVFMVPGSFDMLGTPIDLTRIKHDVYVVGALNDHLVPWQAAYAAARVMGGDVRFVLSNSGHIQALVNPPGNARASFLTNPERPDDVEDWYRSAEKNPGSWWEDWITWTTERSGDVKPRPRRLGNRAHPVLEAAPGRYVHE
jgi:poly[(R)-3-hydroxyalkanoate] polymerase subunit PhaC